jgi:MoxR-like ATPase
MTNPTLTKFRNLETTLNDEVLERNEEIHTALIALVARRHHFQIGPPGTAKSLLVARLAAHIGDLPDDGYFRYLLTQFTVPGELYGPPNLQDMRDKGVYRLNTDGKLPRAHIAFLDEIFKGNSSILNANLTIMNEREFYNAGDDPHIPLISLFAASNEMPQGDNLNALWDRLHFRHEVQSLQETSSFVRMLQHPKFTNEAILTLDDIIEAQEQASKVTISNNCYEAICALRSEMDKEGLSATERRWMDCMSIIQAEAWFNGREVADVQALRPLMHVLWSQLDSRRKVHRLILDVANPLDREAQDLLDKLILLHDQVKKDIAGANGENKQITKLGVELHNKLDKASSSYDILVRKMEETEASSLVIPRIKAKIGEITKVLVNDIFGYDTSSLTKKL